MASAMPSPNVSPGSHSISIQEEDLDIIGSTQTQSNDFIPETQSSRNFTSRSQRQHSPTITNSTMDSTTQSQTEIALNYTQTLSSDIITPGQKGTTDHTGLDLGNSSNNSSRTRTGNSQLLPQLEFEHSYDRDTDFSNTLQLDEFPLPNISFSGSSSQVNKRAKNVYNSTTHGPRDKNIAMISLPNNSTINSTNKGKIIMIQITDTSSIQLLTNPFKINDLLTNSSSPFRNMKIADMRVNRQKSLIVLESTTELDTSLKESLPSITNLGTYTVRCYQPNSDVYIHGVLSPIALDVDLDSLKEHATFSPNATLHSVERLKRKINNKLEESLSIKLTFKSTVLPESCKIFGYLSKIRPYVPQPIQCYNCQRYNHTAGSCKTLARCLLCAGKHKKEECTAVHLHCANCKEAHAANSKECKFMKQAREVETVKVQKKLPYSEARNFVNLRSGNKWPNPTDGPQQNKDSQNQILYSQILSGRNLTSNIPVAANSPCKCKETKPPSKTIGIQTEDSPTRQDSHENFNSKSFLKNLRNFIVEIFTINLSVENEQSKLTLADSAIRNHFGVDLRAQEPGPVKSTLKRKSCHALSSDEADVLSDNSHQSDDSEEEEEEEDTMKDQTAPLWQTVEKKQVLIKTKGKNKKKNKKKKGNEHST